MTEDEDLDIISRVSTIFKIAAKINIRYDCFLCASSELLSQKRHCDGVMNQTVFSASKSYNTEQNDIKCYKQFA